jgi:hypothetical protein
MNPLQGKRSTSMTSRKTLIALGVSAALVAAVGVYNYTASAQGGPGWGPGWMMGGGGPGWGGGPGGGPCGAFGQDGGPGPGWGPGYHMRGWGSGPGMMRGYGGGYGPGYGPGAQTNQALNLTTDDVKARVERWLSFRGNARLKVGEVKEKDADTITADIVTKDNSLVQRFIVDRHTGTFRQDNS